MAETRIQVAPLMHVGIYSIPEAARFTGLDESRVRRWLSGYSYVTSGKRRSSPPVWSGQLAPIGGRRAVSFRDLIEMRFVDAFLRAGVSWKTIRDVQDLARRQFQFDHPFSTNRFRNDGNQLVMTALRDDRQGNLFDVSTRQTIFLEAAEPLREELEMNEFDQVCRWWPLGRRRFVVLDPTRQWGRPLVARSGLPTAVIAAAHQRGMEPRKIAQWLDAQEAEVTDAVAFETGGYDT
ncbi:MAG TPA: hypothetical protein PJ991_11115 [Kiritimatiellia bacterium]|nr:hypothetical protein [Kiritimatiellia bacterium]